MNLRGTNQEQKTGLFLASRAVLGPSFLMFVWHGLGVRIRDLGFIDVGSLSKVTKPFTFGSYPCEKPNKSSCSAPLSCVRVGV